MSGKVAAFFILAILLIIFTIQNQILIDIRFFHWEMKEVPLVLVLLVGLVFGFLLATILQLPKIIKLRRELRNVINELENPKRIDDDNDDDVTSEGVSMGSDYKGGFFSDES